MLSLDLSLTTKHTYDKTLAGLDKDGCVPAENDCIFIESDSDGIPCPVSNYGCFAKNRSGKLTCGIAHANAIIKQCKADEIRLAKVIIK